LRSNLIISFFGATTYGWDKLDNALNHSHLPSSTQKFAKKLGVQAGDVSKAPVPFLPKRRPPFTTQTLNHSLPQQHYNAPLHPAPLYSDLFLCRPPLHPLMLMVMREEIVMAHLTRLVHTHMATTNLLQTVSVGQGTMATTNSTALHADLGNFGHT
jgi:hypothetical protein